MGLEAVIMSEMTQTQKDKYHIFPHFWTSVLTPSSLRIPIEKEAKGKVFLGPAGVFGHSGIKRNNGTERVKLGWEMGTR